MSKKKPLHEMEVSTYFPWHYRGLNWIHVNIIIVSLPFERKSQKGRGGRAGGGYFTELSISLKHH